ncbi:MAG: T9SS type A sorting domain-containing protein [Brumimicrobium sp.]
MKNLKHILLMLSLVGSTPCVFSQVISIFDWDNDPVTVSQFGPNGISVSSSAYSASNGVGGTNGLNAGLPKADIELVLPASAFQSMAGIDFKIDFQRDETRGDFITCGDEFAFGMDNGELFVHFETINNGSVDTIEAFSIYSIPDDDVFRSYRVYYLPDKGETEVLVDGNVVWSHTSTPAPLNWSNQDLVIGHLMDGNGLDKTVFDNIVIAEVYDSALPVEFSSFEVNVNKNTVQLEWNTLSEQNNDYFEVERSKDGQKFENIGTVNGAGTSVKEIDYNFIDKNPIDGTSYYRIKQTDYDGKATYSEVKSVDVSLKRKAKIYPNLLSPNQDFNIELPLFEDKVEVTLIDPLGNELATTEYYNKNGIKMNSPNKSGVYFVLISVNDKRFDSQKIIVR